jgi:hypothetical protein
MIGYEDLVAYGEETGLCLSLSVPALSSSLQVDSPAFGMQQPLWRLLTSMAMGRSVCWISFTLQHDCNCSSRFRLSLPLLAQPSSLSPYLPQRNLMKRVLDELLMNAAASNPI